MRSNDKESAGSAMKVLNVLEAISGYAVMGVSNTGLAQQLSMPASAVTRAAQVLIDKGWARKDPATGRFHPEPRMGQVFGRILVDISRAKQELEDIEHNYVRANQGLAGVDRTFRRDN